MAGASVEKARRSTGRMLSHRSDRVKPRL